MSILLAKVELAIPNNLAIAATFVRWGMEEAAIPADRLPLTGYEEAFFAFDDAVPGVGDAVVGCAIFYQPEDRDLFWLDILYVAESHRREGIGRRLIEKVREEASRRAITKVEFGTSNFAMEALGSCSGFRRAAVIMSAAIDAEMAKVRG